MTAERKTFTDYIEEFKQSYNKDEYDNKDITEAIEELINTIEKVIEMDITINLQKIASHKNEEYEKIFNGLKINREDYSLGIVFNKLPSNDELSRVIACIKTLPTDFNTNFKSIVIEENEEGGRNVNMTILKIQEE